MGGMQGFYISGLDLTNVAPEPAAAVCTPDSDLGGVTSRFQPEQLGGAWCPAQRRKMLTSGRGMLSSGHIWGRSRSLGMWTFYTGLSLKAEK